MGLIRLVPVNQVAVSELEAYRAAFPRGQMQATPDGEHIPGLDHIEDFEDVEQWLKHTAELEGRISWYAGICEADGRMAGALCLRHSLSEDDEDGDFASHIGYSVHPDLHGRGIGREQLRLGLRAAAALGLDTVRIICRDVNTASRRVILACGGVYLDTIHGEESGMNVCRYQVPTGGE